MLLALAIAMGTVGILAAAGLIGFWTGKLGAQAALEAEMSQMLYEESFDKDGWPVDLPDLPIPGAYEDLPLGRDQVNDTDFLDKRADRRR